MNKQLLEPVDCELVVGIVGAVGTKFKKRSLGLVPNKRNRFGALT